MPNYRTTLNGPGTLAYLDSFAGLIPCKVTAVTGPNPANVEITVKLTATRGDYKRGEIITGCKGYRVIPRDKVRTRSGSVRIIDTFMWSEIPGSHPVHLGPSTAGIGTGDVIMCRGDYAIVQRITAHPIGHNIGAPIRSDLIAVEITTDRGTRWIGANRAEIGADLRVHYSLEAAADFYEGNESRTPGARVIPDRAPVQ